MVWEKQGNLFSQTNYAVVPNIFLLSDGTHRIIFCDRDEQNRSIPLSVDLVQVSEVTHFEDKPLLSLGDWGKFDAHGIMPTWLQRVNEALYLFYIGWNRAVDVPFRNAIGLAISNDNGNTFYKYADGPILDRSVHDPCFVASCCTLIEPNGLWRMWYLSCIEWHVDNGQLQHVYHIKYAESDDGIHWRRDGRVCIDFKDETEYAISRPCVIKDDDCYRMWYSYRGESYRIGYAESEDGLHWTRKDDEVGIDVSPAGWDSEMIEYPYVFDHDDQRYLLYNGNGYGRTGIGLAKWHG